MNKEMKGIAITGPMRSGKDTVADYLVDMHGFQGFAFANGIKKICALAFPHLMANGKPRKLYQGVGQEFRKYDPDVWVKYTFNEIAAARPRQAVISDMRQPNEYRHLKNAGFFVVMVNACYETRLERMLAAGDDFEPEDLNHESEQHFKDYLVDFELNNEGTVDELEQQVEAMLTAFERRGTTWAQ